MPETRVQKDLKVILTLTEVEANQLAAILFQTVVFRDAEEYAPLQTLANRLYSALTDATGHSGPESEYRLRQREAGDMYEDSEEDDE